MSGIDVPDGGACHPEAADGGAFNGRVGRGVADSVLAIIAAQHDIKTICDLGCGNGYLAGRLGSRDYTVVGVDASETYLEFAQGHHGSARVTFLQSLVDDLVHRLAASHARFDLVVSTDVIEHMYDPLAFLTTAFALLKDGGTAVICTPYHGYLKDVAISVTGKWDVHHGVHWHGGHIKFFSVASLRNLMVHAGFADPKFQYYGRFPGLWKNMVAVSQKTDTPAR